MLSSAILRLEIDRPLFGRDSDNANVREMEEQYMAEIVLTFAASHGPTMNTPPEKWLQLGEKDQYDVRLGDYQALLRNAKPDIAEELTIERFRDRYASIQKNIKALTGMLNDAKPDVVVVISNPHGGVGYDIQQPTFGIHLNEVPPMTEGPGMVDGAPRADQSVKTAAAPARIRDSVQYPTDGALALHLIEGLIQEEFDVAANFQSRPGAGLDTAYNLLYQKFDTEASFPYVPVLVSRYLPNQATPGRCYQFGQALRRVIERWDSDKRVVVMGSGGLSHQTVDEGLDRMVIKALEDGNAEAIASIPRERLNAAPGTPEILNWVVCAGVSEPKTMTLMDYLPCYRSMAGTGHGNTFGYWK